MNDRDKGYFAYREARREIPESLHSAEGHTFEQKVREWKPDNAGLFRIGWNAAKSEATDE